jgi:hypothetical protein
MITLSSSEYHQLFDSEQSGFSWDVLPTFSDEHGTDFDDGDQFVKGFTYATYCSSGKAAQDVHVFINESAHNTRTDLIETILHELVHVSQALDGLPMSHDCYFDMELTAKLLEYSDD